MLTVGFRMPLGFAKPALAARFFLATVVLLPGADLLLTVPAVFAEHLLSGASIRTGQCSTCATTVVWREVAGLKWRTQ